MTRRFPDETRRRILDAAVEVFAEAGYHDATMEDIVRASGTSKGAIYGHFPSKEDLFFVLIDALVARLLGSVERAIAGVSDPLLRADAALSSVLATFARHRSLARILLIEMAGGNPSVSRKVLEVRERVVDFIARHLDEAVATGVIPPTDTRLAVLVWYGALQEVILRWLHRGEPDLVEIQPRLRALLLRSVGASPEEPTPG